jgi:HEAT repeat protein
MLWYRLRQLKSKDAQQRKKTVQAISQMNDPKVLAVLIDLIRNDPNPEVRATATTALGEVNNQPTTEGLIEALRDKESIVVQAGMQLFHKKSDISLINEVIIGLPRVKSLNERKHYVIPHKVVIETIAQLGQKAVKVILAEKEFSDPNYREGPSKLKVEIITEIGGPEVISALMNAALVKKNYDAAQALEKMGVIPERNQDRLTLAIVQHHFSDVEKFGEEAVWELARYTEYREALIALANIGGRRAIGILVDCLLGNKKISKWEDLQEAVMALKFKNQAELILFATALKRNLPHVRESVALILLENSWTPRTTEEAGLFATTIGDWDTLRGLGMHAFEPAIQLLDSPDTTTVKKAVEILGDLHSEQAVAPFLKLWLRKDFDGDLARTVNNALVQIAMDAKNLDRVLGTIMDARHYDISKDNKLYPKNQIHQVDSEAVHERVFVQLLQQRAKDISTATLQRLADLKAWVKYTTPAGGHWLLDTYIDVPAKETKPIAVQIERVNKLAKQELDRRN